MKKLISAAIIATATFGAQQASAETERQKDVNEICLQAGALVIQSMGVARNDAHNFLAFKQMYMEKYPQMGMEKIIGKGFVWTDMQKLMDFAIDFGAYYRYEDPEYIRHEFVSTCVEEL